MRQIKPPTAQERELLKQQGFSDSQIDAEFGGSQPKPRAVASEATAMTGQPFKRRPDLTAKEEAVGLARSLASGATLGLSNIAEPLFYGLPGGETIEQARERIGQERAKYRAGSPVLAPVAELAGGVATGGALLRGAAQAPRLARTLMNPAVQGGITGATAPEGDVFSKDRLITGAAGILTGGVFGFGANKLLGRATEAAARKAGTRRVTTSPEIGMVEELMDDSRIGPTQVRARAAEMAQASPEARVLDLFGNAGVRMGRRIEALGGEAGEKMSQTMGERLGTKLERMADIFPRITGKRREDVGQAVADILEQRSIEARPMYERVHKQQIVVSPKVESFINSRKSLIDAEKQAIELAAEDGIQLPMMDVGNGMVRPARTPALLDYMKRALDDQVFVAKRPTSGIGKEKQRLINKTRGEFVDLLDNVIPGYQEARSVFAGHTALANAMEDAADFAGRTVQPGEIRRYITGLKSDSEREFFQRGWLNAQVDKIEAGGLTNKQIRTPLYEKQVTEVFGKDAPDIMDALRTEVELAENAGKIVGGSRTAPLQSDIAREMGSPLVGRAREAYNVFRSDPMYPVFRGADIVAERLAGPTRAAARTRRAEALTAPAGSIGNLLDAVQRDYQYRTLGRNVGRVVGPAVGAQSVRSIADLLGGGYQE